MRRADVTHRDATSRVCGDHPLVTLLTVWLSSPSASPLATTAGLSSLNQTIVLVRPLFTMSISSRPAVEVRLVELHHSTDAGLERVPILVVVITNEQVAREVSR